LKRQKGIVKCNWELKKMVKIVGNLEWELLTFISNLADGLVYPSTLSGEVLCDALRLVWCVCVRPSLCPPPMVSRYNLRTDFKFCTVVWYHKIQIKFEFQCDQIIGSKFVTVWRLKICETWQGMKIQGKQFLICYTGDELN
jgi:hypothetical protein